MTTGDLITLLPLIVLSATPVVVMLAAAFYRSHGLALGVTLAGLAAAFGTIFIAATRDERQVTPLLVFDDFSLLFIGLLLVATAAVAVLSWGYLTRRGVHPEEFYVLLLAATVGGVTMVASTHFASLFLGLEILSVSLYVLIVYPMHRSELVEAAVKYLVLAGATSAFLVFGMGLVYAETGALSSRAISAVIAGGFSSSQVIVAAGVVILLVGLGFKLAVVPFHMWTPDVYQGAPVPVTAYIATVSKGAVFVLLLRYLGPLGLHTDATLFLALTAVAMASMIAGNLLALRQDNVKRLLAYSSIAHLGYMLVAFLAAGDRSAVAVTLYLVVYVATNLAAFGVITVLSPAERDAELIEDYRGLGTRRPALAAIFTIALLSLAGMPLTAGFVGKFYLLTAGTGAALWGLVVVLVLTSTIGLYYYTRLVVAMYVQEPLHEPARLRRAVPVAASVVLVLLTVVVIVLGVYPGPLVDLIERAVATLG